MVKAQMGSLHTTLMPANILFAYREGYLVVVRGQRMGIYLSHLHLPFCPMAIVTHRAVDFKTSPQRLIAPGSKGQKNIALLKINVSGCIDTL